MIGRVIPILAFLTATPTPHPAQANAAPAGHCVGAGYRQFDFWVGSWDVYPTGQSQLVAHSLIESVYNGCGVRENWMPLKTENSGGSLNIYIPAKNLWRQTWIDSSGARVDFKALMTGHRPRARDIPRVPGLSKRILQLSAGIGVLQVTPASLGHHDGHLDAYTSRDPRHCTRGFRIAIS
jgi:hypothetical protein